MSLTANLPIIKKLFPRKLPWKLTLIYAALFSAILIALNAGTLFGVRYYLIEQAKDQVYSSLSDTLKQIDSSKGKIDLSNPEYVSGADTISEINIDITDTSGRQINSSNSKSRVLSKPSSKIAIIEFHGRHYVIESSGIMENGKLIGYLQVSYDMRSEYRFIKLLFIFMAIADLLGVAFSILTGLLISRRAFKPIDNLTQTARKISGSDLSQRVEVGAADDELSRLALTFNEMIERLQVSFEKQKQFVSDASHELRTPIAIIKGYADLIEQWAKNDPKVLEESVSAIRKEAGGMTSLIEDLLFLARGDSGKFKLQEEDFKISNLFDEITEESRLIAVHHKFEWTAPENLMLHADRKLLKQALRALVDNAVKYTPECGQISLYAFETGKNITVEVTDTGIGIPESEQHKIFDRFYRVNKDRSKETGGSGLGLSIVKLIVEAHNGRITVESNKSKGTKVTVRLPKA